MPGTVGRGLLPVEAAGFYGSSEDPSRVRAANEATLGTQTVRSQRHVPPSSHYQHHPEAWK